MMATLEWATLMVCCAALLLRVPDAVRGRNRTVFGILFLGTCAVCSPSPNSTRRSTALLGGWDLTSLILRYLVFAAVLLVGLRVTRGLAAARAHRLISGGTGRWALGLGCLAVTVAFFLMARPGHRPGCRAPGGGAGNADLAPIYTAAGRTYPAFVSLVLVPPLLAAVRSRLPRTRQGRRPAGPARRRLRGPEPSGRPGAVQLGGRRSISSTTRRPWATSWASSLFWFSGLIAGPSGNARATLRQNTD